MSFRPAMSALDWGLLVFLSILWGGSYFFGRIAVAEVGPLTLVFARFAPAALILYGACRLAGHRMPTGLRPWTDFFVMSALNNAAPYALIAWSQMHIEIGLASILNASTPIFGAVLAHFLTPDEKLTVNRVVGVLLGFFGVALLIGPEALQGFGVDGLAALAALGAAFLYGCAGVYGRRFRGEPALVTTTDTIFAGAIMALPLALLFEHPWTLSPSSAAWGAIAGLAILSTALGYAIFYRVLASAGGNILLVTLLVPVSALVLGTLFLGEHPSPLSFLGMALIFLGLAAIDGRLPRALGLMRLRA